MAIIKPFKGIRPPKDLVEKVESRPYDVLDSEEARAEAGDNEMSLYHIIKPEIDFPVGTSEYDPKVYEKAAENFQKFQDKGWLVQDAQDHYYIYAQTMNGKTQYGLVVCAHTDDYMAGRIKKHELTRRDKEEDRMKHVRVNNANIEPVFFAYPDNSVLNALIMRYAATEPEYDFIAPIDGFRHQFWHRGVCQDAVALYRRWPSPFGCCRPRGCRETEAESQPPRYRGVQLLHGCVLPGLTTHHPRLQPCGEGSQWHEF